MDPKARLYLPYAWRLLAILGVVCVCLVVVAASSGSNDIAGAIILLGLGIACICILIVLLAIIGLFIRSDDNRYFLGSLFGGIAVGAAGLFVAAVSLLSFAAIAPWGRPLRIRGKMVHPSLAPGGEWAAGDKPNCEGLSPASREALATLWHHDAQKEHASVPAFSRLAWLLAGLGAPAELLEHTHRAGMQEIDHARRCFALAGGYAGKNLTVQPMPEILQAPLGVGRDPLLAVALESLRDGCLVEDFNADVARVAAEHARDPAAKKLAEIIARDEREHADLAWQVVEWCIAVGGPRLKRALAAATEKLPITGPRAYAQEDGPLVATASPQALVDHGRVPADQWAAIYDRRRARTCARMAELLRAETITTQAERAA